LLAPMTIILSTFSLRNRGVFVRLCGLSLPLLCKFFKWLSSRSLFKVLGYDSKAKIISSYSIFSVSPNFSAIRHLRAPVFFFFLLPHNTPIVIVRIFGASAFPVFNPEEKPQEAMPTSPLLLCCLTRNFAPRQPHRSLNWPTPFPPYFHLFPLV